MPSANDNQVGSTSIRPRKAAEENSNKSRRDFLKSALAFSVVLVVAGIAAVTRSLWDPPTQLAPETSGGSTPPSSFPRVKVANTSDLKVNQPITFNYPLDSEPNIIVRLGKKAQNGVGPDGDIVAFSEICQHQVVSTVSWRPALHPHVTPRTTRLDLLDTAAATAVSSI